MKSYFYGIVSAIFFLPVFAAENTSGTTENSNLIIHVPVAELVKSGNSLPVSAQAEKKIESDKLREKCSTLLMKFLADDVVGTNFGKEYPVCHRTWPDDFPSFKKLSSQKKIAAMHLMQPSPSVLGAAVLSEPSSTSVSAELKSIEALAKSNAAKTNAPAVPTETIVQPKPTIGTLIGPTTPIVPIPFEPGPVIPSNNPSPKPTPQPVKPQPNTSVHPVTPPAMPLQRQETSAQLVFSQAVNNLNNPFFVKSILENTVFSFPLNTTQYWAVLSQAKDDLWEMQRINFVPNQWNTPGNLNYQGTAAQVITNNAALNQTYQKMLTNIQNLFPQDPSLGWLNFNQAIVFPTALYQSPSDMTGAILTLKICGEVTCHDKWLGFYQLNQDHLCAYFKHAGAAYLLGVQNPAQLSLILGLVAKDQAEVQVDA